MPSYTFLHNLLNVIVQIPSIMGLQGGKKGGGEKKKERKKSYDI
jgi:hypothetical protein